MGRVRSTVRETAGEPYEADTAEDLGEKIATLAAHIHAATHRFLVLIARFDRLRGWEPAGHRTCAHWLAFRTGLDLGTAREHVRVGRSLEALPRTGASMARGALSFSQVRALTRVARPENEEDLLALAEGCTTAQLEHLVRAWKKNDRRSEAELESLRHATRELAVFPDEEGMYLVRGRLDPETGAVLMRALEAACDALYRQGPRHESSPAQRRADAIGLVAEQALAAGYSSGGSRRYQVVLHTEAATLAAEGEPGRSELEDGTRVSAETSRRLACDAGLVGVEHAADGSVLDVGRRTRTIPAALRRALETRDGGCRFPGCGLRFTDAHHVVHWADGGETSLRNTVLICRHHHRLVHEEGWKVEWWGPGRPGFRDPRGSLHLDARWRPPELPPDPVESLEARNRLQGAEPDARTAGARWKRERDIPDPVWFRALEAAL